MAGATIPTSETTNNPTNPDDEDEIVNVVDASGASVPDDDTPRPKAGRAGRPPLQIPLRQLHAVASTFATMEEIAVFFDCDPDTLRRRYSREIAKGRAMGKMNVRQEMRTRAKRSDRVLIHLYEKHVEAPPLKGDTVVQIVGDAARPLIVREVDEDSDTMR